LSTTAQQKKNDEQFPWKRACAREFESGYQKHSENFSKKKDDMLKAQGVQDNPRTTRGTPILGRGTPILGCGTPIPGHGLGDKKKIEIVFVHLMFVRFDFWRFVCAQLQ